MQTKSYIEIKVPFTYQTDSFNRLRHVLYKIPVRWQQDFYHITMAFIDDTQNVDDIKRIVFKIFALIPPIEITFDKFDAFTTPSGMHIIHLSPSNIPDELRLLNENLRKEIIDSGSSMNSDFYLHVTLGRIKGQEIALDNVRRLVNQVKFSPFTISLREVVYRYFRGNIINKVILNKNISSDEYNRHKERDTKVILDSEHYASLCKYYQGELSCPEEWENNIKGKFWYGEMMFCTNHISIDEFTQMAQRVIKELKGDKLRFAQSMPISQFGMVLYIELLFGKWCPYDDLSWIFDY